MITENVGIFANRVAIRMNCSRLSYDVKFADVGQVEGAPGLCLIQDPHLDELGTVIICVNLGLKYDKWGIKSMGNSAFK